MNKMESLYKEMKNSIEDLQHHWKRKTEKEIEYLCKKMGAIARGEYAWYRRDALSDPNLPNELLHIGNLFDNNYIILSEIISSIDNMYKRYGLVISDAIFEFLLKNTQNKKVAFYIALFITTIPQFDNYEKKWEYILSVPNITPKKKSILVFQKITDEMFTKIPESLKNEVIKIFQDYLDKNPDLHQYTREEYEEIIKRLQR